MGIRLDHDTKCDITMRIPLIKSNHQNIVDVKIEKLDNISILLISKERHCLFR